MLLPTEKLRERHAADKAYVSRDPNGMAFLTECVWVPDEETGERCPNGYVRGGMGVVSKLMREAAEREGARIHLRQAV